MVTSSHVKRKLRSLKLVGRKFMRMTFDVGIRRRMRSLWIRKRVTDPDMENLGDYYERAFAEYLEQVKVPKQMKRVVRQTARLHVRETVAEQVQQLQRIAIKRQQPMAVVIEEALEIYLDKPENFLGSDEEPKERVQRII